jgi:hypothetical protein
VTERVFGRTYALQANSQYQQFFQNLATPWQPGAPFLSQEPSQICSQSDFAGGAGSYSLPAVSGLPSPSLISDLPAIQGSMPYLSPSISASDLSSCFA